MRISIQLKTHKKKNLKSKDIAFAHNNSKNFIFLNETPYIVDSEVNFGDIAGPVYIMSMLFTHVLIFHIFIVIFTSAETSSCFNTASNYVLIDEVKFFDKYVDPVLLYNNPCGMQIAP